MGWASGAELAGDIIEVVKSQVPDKDARAAIYRHLIDKFERFDCDTLDECVGIDKVYDKVYKSRYPDDEE